MRTEKPHVDIENWAVVESVASPAYRELAAGCRLTGYVCSHEELPNALIFTSAIVSVDRAAGLVETRNSIYHLGRIAKDYAQWMERQSASRAA